MKNVAAYLILVLGGNANPSAADVTKVIQSAGGTVEQAALDALIKSMTGKSAHEVSWLSHLFKAHFNCDLAGHQHRNGKTAKDASRRWCGSSCCCSWWCSCRCGRWCASKERRRYVEWWPILMSSLRTVEEEESEGEMGFGLFD
eukprot:Selendium_serpulae@DN5984_c0_g1_i3.p1